MLDVILACQYVGSLVYGSRAYEPAVFEDEVKDYLEANKIKVDRNVEERGASGTKYTVNFRAQSTGGSAALISAISPKNNAMVRGKVNYNFRMWSDLNGSLPQERKINLLNDDQLTFKQEDTNILERVSTVYRWTSKQKLISALQGNSPLSPQSVG